MSKESMVAEIFEALQEADQSNPKPMTMAS